MAEYIKLESLGTILKEEFMEPYGLSINVLSKAISVSPGRISGIIHGLRRISADTDLRLCRFFGLSDGYFLRLQTNYETISAKREIKDKLASIVPLSNNIKSAVSLKA